MDAVWVNTVLLTICGGLLGITAFFLKNLISKFDVWSEVTLKNTLKIEFLDRQMVEIHAMRQDVSDLKGAILPFIKSRR